MKRVIKSWAVMARVSPDSDLGPLGHGWFGWPAGSHLLGCTISLFPTRREARAQAKRLRALNYGPVHAHAARVVVTIEKVGR